MSSKNNKNSKNSKPYQRKGSVKGATKGSSVQSKKQDIEKEKVVETENISSPSTTINNPNTKTITETKTETIKPKVEQEKQEPEKRITTQPSGSKTTTQHPQTQKTKTRHGLIALGVIGGTIVVGIIATLLGGPLDESYTKPPAYPPDWLFPVVWTILYISIGIAAYIAFLSVGDGKKRKTDIAWYGVHLFFNFMWPLFYFTFNWLIFSCIWLTLVVVTSIVVTYRYYRANLASGIIFTVYTLWLLYALYLSLGTTILNVM